MRVRFLLASLALLVGAGVLVAQAPVDLSGTWRLNAEASDVGGAGDEADTSRGPIGGFGMPGRQPLGGYGSPGGMGSPSGVQVDPETRKQRIELLRELLEPVRRFTIVQDASSVTFTYADGRTVRYRTDGRAEKHQANNGTVETETRWKKGRLVRETNLDDGLSIEETFSLTSPRGLSVEVESSGGGRKPLRRIYDPVD
jgi:hypothetical protein